MLIRVFPPHYQLVYINFDISSFSLISYLVTLSYLLCYSVLLTLLLCLTYFVTLSSLLCYSVFLTLSIDYDVSAYNV